MDDRPQTYKVHESWIMTIACVRAIQIMKITSSVEYVFNAHNPLHSISLWLFKKKGHRILSWTCVQTFKSWVAWGILICVDWAISHRTIGLWRTSGSRLFFFLQYPAGSAICRLLLTYACWACAWSFSLRETPQCPSCSWKGFSAGSPFLFLGI